MTLANEAMSMLKGVQAIVVNLLTVHQSRIVVAVFADYVIRTKWWPVVST